MVFNTRLTRNNVGFGGGFYKKKRVIFTYLVSKNYVSKNKKKLMNDIGCIRL